MPTPIPLKQKRLELLDVIRPILDQTIPDVPPPLASHDAFTLLVAVLLSAQCTDERVNKVTPELFAIASGPAEMVALGIERIEAIIRPCGLSNNKSKAIWTLSEILLRLHGGCVPRRLDELQKLPGVGRKTASVVMVQAFGVPAFPVDTHVIRLAGRWGLSSEADARKVEEDLCELIPAADWGRFHLQMIYFGRRYCTAKSHRPELCPVCSQLNT
jgi:endonuclease-3